MTRVAMAGQEPGKDAALARRGVISAASGRAVVPRIYLAVRGDDMGSSRSANRAISHALANRVLLNVSVMVPGPVFDQAAGILRQSDACVGLHVTLTSEFANRRWGPLLPPERVPSLLDSDGCFFRTTQELHDHGMQVEEAICEVKAQLAHARAAGLHIAYLDEHMGVGWVNGLGQRLRELAAAEHLLYVDDLPHVQCPPLVNAAARPSVQHLCRDLVAALRAHPPGSCRLVLHPAFEDAEMAALFLPGDGTGTFVRRRDADRRLVCAVSVRKQLEAAGIRPVRFCELAAGCRGEDIN